MKKLLKTYSKKRNFSKTLEPQGNAKTKNSKGLIFVIQEHHASHLHYDFRLELDGVLKSWAVPKGPSMKPEDKRLAIEVEDHPLDYAKFHGTIPKGQYGGGEVYIWDKGTWEVDGDPHQGLKKGKLEFTLKGKKLKGHFVLVRIHTPDDSKKHNWLLMKKTDKEVDSHFELEPIAANEEEAVKLKKVKKKVIKKDKWPGFVPPQLSLLVDAPPEDSGWVHEIKYDGYRIQAHLQKNKINLFTRNANDWSEKFKGLVAALKKLSIESAIFDGEAVVLDDRGRSNFGLLQDALSLGDDSKIKLFIFDLLFLNGEDLRELSLKERKEKLKRILPKSNSVIFYSEDVKKSGADFFKIACQHELEGIVSKYNSAVYSSGRSRIWCKSKCTKRQEFVIGGFTEGKGHRESELGALLLGVYEKHEGQKKFRYVGSVGSGFDNKSLIEVKKKVEKLEQKKSSFDIKAPKSRGIHWIKPKLVAEVKFSNWTTDQSLRHPVFLGFRNDKDINDIFIEKAAHLTKSDLKIEVHENVEITHPEKIIFPKEKISKQIIANYYQKVSIFMLPFVSDRPLSLVRCPEGAGKKCFYQKHPGPGVVSKNFKSFKVKEKSESGLYISLNSPEGLRQLVQMNAFEIHTWNCHYQTLQNPDQIVMDFDPDPTVNFKTVVKACLEMKKTLDKLKLKSFVKVTGGKGIHIHIPIEPLYSWEEVTAFSKVLADEMVLRFPDLYIATMSKTLRKGKIFIDYLRNGYGSTAVAPYAIRARKISAVALPVDWIELATLKSSDQFTIKKALAKIKSRKSDPWKKFLSVKQRITILD